MKKLFVMLFIAMISSALGISSAAQKPMLLENDNQISTSKIINTSNYINLTISAMNMHMQDLIYSAVIRREFFDKNISSIEALAATISLYTLNSEIQREIQSINPPREVRFQEYHKNIIESMSHFKRHLFFMAKFYETSDRKYLNASREQFNISSDKFNKAMNLGRNISQTTNYLKQLSQNGTPVNVSKLGFPT